jgi:Do/DeqQ family serine protease
VNVYGTSRPQNARARVLEDDFYRRFFGDNGLGVPQDRAQRSLGSGVIVDTSGLVVTNHHVIEGMTEVRVSLADKREFEAEIVLRDPRTDLAVLRLKGQGPFPIVQLGDSESIEVGDIVLAIGNPFGVGQTVTMGIVSALARTQIGVSDYQFFIQTDAAINPGNSGGALIDAEGKLVGINTAIYSRSGGNVGIGFAVPAAMVKVVVASAKMGGASVRRPYFGARLQAVTAEVAQSLGLPRPEGALVAEVTNRSAAHAAGLVRGDVIIALDGRPIDSPEGFSFRFATKPLGGEAELTILRGTRTMTLSIKLEGPPETTPRDRRTLSGRHPFEGATVVNVSPAVAEEFSLDGVNQGVVIVEVGASTAARLGFRNGDIILAVNRFRVESTRGLESILQEQRQGFWQVTIRRGNQTFTTVFQG